MMHRMAFLCGWSAMVVLGCGDDPGTGGANSGGSGASSSGGDSSGGTNSGGTNAGGTNSGGTNSGGTNIGGNSAGGNNAGGNNAGGAGGGGQVTVQSCTDVCNVAVQGNCSPFSCECAMGCGAVVPLASAANCQTQAEAYFTCLTADATPCDNGCDNEFNAVVQCVVPYCIGSGDPNCQTVQGCAGN